eukprot:12819632-Ditylum_brightwellii.AAC.1
MARHRSGCCRLCWCHVGRVLPSPTRTTLVCCRTIGIAAIVASASPPQTTLAWKWLFRRLLFTRCCRRRRSCSLGVFEIGLASLLPSNPIQDFLPETR